MQEMPKDIADELRKAITEMTNAEMFDQLDSIFTNILKQQPPAEKESR